LPLGVGKWDTPSHSVPIVRRSQRGGEPTTFPLPDTSWTDWYLHGDGSLTTAAPTAEESPQPYVTGTTRQFWSYQAGGDVGPPLTTAAGPDELSYRSEPVATDTAIAGPITATLFMQSTAPDTELFVDVVDEAPDGSRTYLQRGFYARVTAPSTTRRATTPPTVASTVPTGRTRTRPTSRPARPTST